MWIHYTVSLLQIVTESGLQEDSSEVMCTASLHDTVRNSQWTSQSCIKRPWDAIRGLAAVEAEGWAGERTAILETSGFRNTDD